MHFLSYDGPLMAALRKLINYTFLGILWLLVSIPVITFGAATTAALQTAEASIRQDEGRILHTFFTHFRHEFKQATLLWVLELAVLAVLYVDISLVIKSSLSGVLQFVIYAILLVVFCWIQLWFGYLSKFVDTTRTLLRNTFLIMIASFGQSFLMSLLTVVSLIGGFLTFPLLIPIMLLIPGLYIMGYIALLHKVLAKYLPAQETEESVDDEQIPENIS